MIQTKGNNFYGFFFIIIVVTTVHMLTTTNIYDQDMAGGPTGTPHQVCLSLHLQQVSWPLLAESPCGIAWNVEGMQIFGLRDLVGMVAFL